jgi:GT2 family glycosyltransferase
MTVSIVTPWLNASELIMVYENTTRGAQVIIVDNGSEWMHARHLEAYCNRVNGLYIRNETNTGFSHANNQGLKVATGDIVMFLNNDVQGRGAWLDRVEQEVKPGALYGISILNKHGFDYIEGWCIAARREVWDKLNGWDEGYYSGLYWEDNDLCFRAHKLGIRLERATWPLWHFNNYTTSKTPGSFDHSAENERLFLQRVASWGK